MKSTLLLGCLVAAVSLVEGVFILGTAATGTIAVGTAAGAAGLAALGGLALGVGAAGALALASRRGKRSVELPVKREGLMWDMVAATDVQGCALKFVCLVQASDAEALSDDEAIVASLFSRGSDGVDFDQLQSAKGPYSYASFMGERFGADACEKLFHRCQYDMTQMLAYFHALIEHED